jgi:hypothetical protein
MERRKAMLVKSVMKDVDAARRRVHINSLLREG